MFRIKMTAAMLLVAGSMSVLAGCKGEGAKTSPNAGNDPRVVRSTYGNITDWDENGWNRAARPAPAPAPMAAKPAPAPAPVVAKPMPQPQPQTFAGNCMYLPTGDKGTSALSICCRMPGEVTANTNFTYEVEICNLTGQALNNVVVVYTLEGARIVSSDPPISGTGFAVGDLAPRQCRIVKVTANAAGTGTVKGCTSATWANALCCGTNVVAPALKIVKTVTPTSGVTKCDVITYTIVVTNTGTGNATNVKVRDQLPNGVKTSDGRTLVEQSLGTLAGGQSQTITFQAMLPKDGTYVNNAQATADNGLTAASNDATVVGVQPVLTLTKQCPQKLRVGQPATFKITVSNTGDSPANNVVVEDPTGTFAFGSASDSGAVSGNAVRWNVGTLAPRTTKELTVSFRANAMGKVNNVARATATCAEPVSANCDCEFIGTPDIGTLLTDNDGVVTVGDNHEYRVAVKNQGQIPLTNTKFTVTLPASMAYVSSAFKHTVAGNKVTFDIGTLAAGAEVNFNYMAKGLKAGEALSIGETTCTELQTPVRDDELTNFVDK